HVECTAEYQQHGCPRLGTFRLSRRPALVASLTRAAAASGTFAGRRRHSRSSRSIRRPVNRETSYICCARHGATLQAAGAGLFGRRDDPGFHARELFARVRVSSIVLLRFIAVTLPLVSVHRRPPRRRRSWGWN